MSEGATALYRAVLDQTCIARVSVVRRLPEFQARAVSELLGRTASLADDIGAVLARLPRTSLDAPRGREHDDEFRRRYLELVSTELDTAPRTLLRGDAGSGKTTLLQWIAVNCARGGFTGQLAAWNGRVPFFVRLRSYGDRHPPRPEEFPAGVADPILGVMPEGWVHRQTFAARRIRISTGFGVPHAWNL